MRLFTPSRCRPSSARPRDGDIAAALVAGEGEEIWYRGRSTCGEGMEVTMLGLRCTECGGRSGADRLATLCEECARPWAVEYDLERVRDSVSFGEVGRRARGMWRWREVLPLSRDEEPVSLGEGDTPLLSVTRFAERLGLGSVYVKDEALNPTGSFKARGMSAAVSMARALGVEALAVPTAGNAGGAAAAYGARAGLSVRIAMPSDTPRANVVEAEVCGAEVEFVEGTIADCGRRIREYCAESGAFDLSTLKEPYRVEGKKIMGYELAEHFDRDLPDAILYPTGGGTGLVGMMKAFDEMRELGWVRESAMPRMYSVQAAGCAPIVDAFEAGADAIEPPAAPYTVASGLRVPTPVGDRWMLRDIRRSGGGAVAIDDEALLEGTRELSATEGIFVAPEAGALAAALVILIERGEIGPADRVVLFNTGAGVKYLECFE